MAFRPLLKGGGTLGALELKITNSGSQGLGLRVFGGIEEYQRSSR